VSSRREELAYFDSTLEVGKRLQLDIQRVSRRIKRFSPELHLSYFFFSKTLKSLGATRVLWASSFFQDALVISRSIFEACLLDSYIRTDRAALTDRYLAHDKAARHNMSVGMVRSMKNRRGRPWQVWKAAAARYGRAAKNLPYEFGDARGWSGKSLREIVRLHEKKYGSEGVWMDYEFFYCLGSAVAHSSSQSVQEYMRQPHMKSYQQNGQRRGYLRDLPFLACRWCLVTGLLSAQDHFRVDEDFVPSDAFVDAYQLLRSLSHALGEDLKELDSKFFL
jgi:hypothetical protein